MSSSTGHRQHCGMPTDTPIDPDPPTGALRKAGRALGDVPPVRDVTSLPDELHAVAGALRMTADACARAAGRVVPAAAVDRSIGDRYQRAAASWPVLPPPSREGFAALLTALHEAASTVGQAADRCEHAKRALEAALHRANEPPAAA
jgi:hypothetical protein